MNLALLVFLSGMVPINIYFALVEPANRTYHAEVDLFCAGVALTGAVVTLVELIMKRRT